MTLCDSAVDRQLEPLPFQIQLDSVQRLAPSVEWFGQPVEESEVVPGDGSVTLRLVDVSAPDSDESWKGVWGEELLRRANARGVPAGRRCGGAMLAKGLVVPVSWREFFLLMPGTVWQDFDGRRFILCCSWQSDRLRLCSIWLHESFSHLFRVVLIG